MKKNLAESVAEYYLNLVQLEMSASAFRTIMKTKPAFKTRWLFIFNKYKSQGKTPKEARELANKITGVF